MNTLSYAQVQEVRERFATMARFGALPIMPDRSEGERIVLGTGIASQLKFAAPMLGPDGDVRPYACYTPSGRRFAIHPLEGAGPWRVSENTIGVMVNPSGLSDTAFAEVCYRYLLASETGESFEAEWLDDPVIWPKRVHRPEELVVAQSFIPDIRPYEEVVYARTVLGDATFVARRIPEATWHQLTWHDAEGARVDIRPATTSLVGTVRTWRIFLNEFLDHAVPFMLDEEGHRATAATRGPIHPAEVFITGIERTGRTDWVEGEAAETLITDPGAWERILTSLSDVPGADLNAAGLASRTSRALRAGRTPSRRSTEAARAVVARRELAAAGLAPDRCRVCSAPNCGERLRGRQRSFCTTHAAYPGSRRKAWREAAG